MDEELKACPFCHREAQQTLCSGLVSCAYEDCPAFLLAVFPESWNARAKPAPPAPDAELVALLQDASQWFADRDIDINLARDIDAKLASLKGVEA